MSHYKVIIAPNSISAGALSQTPMGSSQHSHRLHSWNLGVLLLRKGKREEKGKEGERTGNGRKGKKGRAPNSHFWLCHYKCANNIQNAGMEHISFLVGPKKTMQRCHIQAECSVHKQWQQFDKYNIFQTKHLIRIYCCCFDEKNVHE